ncbi:MAG: SGNH/GDSL hydrolase family protein [Nitrospirota bacterium]
MRPNNSFLEKLLSIINVCVYSVVSTVVIIFILEVLARTVIVPTDWGMDPRQINIAPHIPVNSPDGKLISISDLVNKNNYDGRCGFLYPYPYVAAQSVSNVRSPSCNSNQQGFRDSSFDEIIKDSRKKVLLLGGSGMWGAGATNDNTTIRGYLQRCFDSKNLPYRAVSLAMPGFLSMSELITFERIAPRLQPDWVIVMNGGNDVAQAMYQPAPGNPIFYLESEILLGNAYKSKKSTLYSLANSMELVRSMKRWLKLEKAHYNELFDYVRNRTSLVSGLNDNKSISNEIVTQYYYNMRSLIQLSQANNVNMLLVLQPSVCTINPSNDLEAKLGTSVFFKDTYALLHEKQRILSEKYGISQLNGGDIFNRDNTTATKIVDQFHYTDYGNELLATEFCSIIEKKQQ